MRRGRNFALLLLCCVLAVAGDTGAQAPTCGGGYQEIGPNAIKVPVPDVRQGDSYSCGAASLMAILAYYGVGPDDYGTLKRRLGITRQGADFRKMVQFARRQGLHAEARQNMKVTDLVQCLNAHQAVICSIQAYDDKRHTAEQRRALYRDKDLNGHFVVAIGFDNDNIFFMDPSMDGRRGFLPKEEFEDRWHDNEGTERKPDLIRHLSLVIWRDGPPAYPRCALKIP